MPKKTSRPRPLSRAGRGKGPGARVFWDPVHPVTNCSSCCILALMVLRMFLRIIVCTKSGQKAHVWHWRPKRSSGLNVMLASEPEREDTGFWVRLTCYGLRLEVACFKMHPYLPFSHSMAPCGTGEANHDAIDATKKIRFGNPKHFLAPEVLSPCCLWDLGEEESICYLLGYVHTH